MAHMVLSIALPGSRSPIIKCIKYIFVMHARNLQITHFSHLKINPIADLIFQNLNRRLAIYEKSHKELLSGPCTDMT